MLRKSFTIGLLLLLFTGCKEGEKTKIDKIDREAVFNRHTVHINEVDTLNSLSLGNGRFAMTMDVTGLQTFPEAYKKGVSLGTQSEWGWHSFPTEKKYTIEQTLDSLESHGRKVPYAVQWPQNSPQGEAANYLRQNPHRIHLANVGWYIEKEDGSHVSISDIKEIDQQLNMWKGELTSNFQVDGVPVEVISLVDQNKDILAVQVKSKLVEEGRIGLHIKYPYPTDHFLDEAAFYDSDEPKRLDYKKLDSKNSVIERRLDSTQYYTSVSSSQDLLPEISTDHGFIIKPEKSDGQWSFSVLFSESEPIASNQDFTVFQNEVHTYYESFWNSGGIIDFGKVTDKRAKELERRMVLSLYLTKINCGGSSPPQETGLTFNSWYGKPHMEMIWWHGVHYAQWGRTSILEKQLDWYFRSKDIAMEIAKRQGFKGVRWQKMTDPNGGETASSVGSYLIWQQPHIIYFSELVYNDNPSKEVLEKYAPLVEETAAFMADFAWYDATLNEYILGPGVIAAQERFDPKVTYNPTFELAYWKWGLEKAQNWRERLGKERNAEWDQVLNGLSPLPHKDGLYLAAASALDSYSTEKYMTDHPSVLGAYGMLPAIGELDKEIMQNTFDKVWKDWHWEDTWGWDFPMTAMTAARLGHPEKAVDALLMSIPTNTYLKNGHNYQDERLRLYLPGNGGFLSALALMAAGSEGDISSNIGFPKSWLVQHEGLQKMY
ncbi:hypothetical protein J0X14_17425 [Muricauda sp. CAU 1633]|uniref:hypothetical protein n=1 Tax=Allomuricauda sp. CAU 1633 TaxID=2816036 RepID=UPI001A8CB76C|nr:hypothetical protein [Muricauda sp. CAU 1633]MBO0324094.1 hypothetical protein [Muricauda sp. CAU 1633]